MILEVNAVKKKLVTILLVIVVVLALGIAGALGFVWYRDNHVFVEGDAYPLSAQSIDLREEDISFAYFEELQAKLPGCKIVWNVPFQTVKASSDSQTLTVSDLSEEDMQVLLTYFPDLKTLDATSGSSLMNYQVLEAFQEARPACQVLYEVDLGGKRVAPDTTELELSNGEYDFETLIRNMTYLRRLASLKLRTPELTNEQVEQIRSAFPEVSVTCTTEIMGQEYDVETTELDLSALTSDGVAEVAEKLVLLPKLENVNLMAGDGTSQLTKDDVKTLMHAAPTVVFNYTFDFFGTTVSTAEEEIVLTNENIGDEKEAEVRLALDLLKNCRRLVLDNCKLSNEVLSKIRDDYRDQTKVVWRVWFGGGSSLTDAEAIRCTYDLLDDNCHDLVYCEDVRFVDFGHNEWLDACDFVSGMVNLEYCILSGAPIKSLEPFANCKKLKFLEIAFCEYITDLSPLASCESLQMLNVSNTHGLDLTPLDNLPLTHFCARTNPSGRSRVSAEEQARFIAQHPDCWTSFDGAQPYGVGWRYGEDEITPLPQYALIQKVFKLPHAPNNTGWYLDEEVKEMIAAMEPAGEGASVPEETTPETTAVE